MSDSEDEYEYESEGDDFGSPQQPSPPKSRVAATSQPSSAAGAADSSTGFAVPASASTASASKGGSDDAIIGSKPAPTPSVLPSTTAKESTSAAAGLQHETAEYRIVEPGELAQEVTRRVIALRDVLEIPTDVCESLLVATSWSRERVMERFLEDGDKLLEEQGLADVAKVPDGECPVRTPISIVGADAGAGGFCEICFNELPASEALALPCNHAFCGQCWRASVDAALQLGGEQALRASCPSHGCVQRVTRRTVSKVCSPSDSQDEAEAGLFEEEDEEEEWDGSGPGAEGARARRRRRRGGLAQWAHLTEHSMVATARNMAWCPAPGCEHAFVAKGAGPSDVKCPCGTRFCFRCGKESHSPVTCDSLAAWQAKCADESETAHWIVANTKRCPKCSVRIEKNQGCNHIICRSCKHEFCWVCEGDWASHGQSTGGYYACNKYDPSKAGGGKDGGAGGADSAKAELDRYLFYYQRFDNHDRARRFAARLRERTQRRVQALAEAGGGTWSDATFLEEAIEALLECRRVLKFTYVLGYYMPGGHEKVLFEHLQEHLERATEELAALTEQPVERVADQRQEVVNYTRVTQRFLRQLLGGIEEGLTGGGAGAGAGAAPGGAGEGVKPAGGGKKDASYDGANGVPRGRVGARASAGGAGAGRGAGAGAGQRSGSKGSVRSSGGRVGSSGSRTGAGGSSGKRPGAGTGARSGSRGARGGAPSGLGGVSGAGIAGRGRSGGQSRRRRGK